jgi:IPT/TIG domain
MRIYLNCFALLVALALPGTLPSHAAGSGGVVPLAVPMMRNVEPDSGKTGEVLEIQGENLGKENISAVYLTDGTTDLKVAVIEQTETSIRFRIPTLAKPGRFAIMVLTNDKPPRLIEEPVKITVLPETAGFVN